MASTARLGVGPNLDWNGLLDNLVNVEGLPLVLLQRQQIKSYLQIVSLLQPVFP